MDSFLDFLSRPYAGFAAVFGFLLVLSLLWFAIGKLFLARRIRRLYLVILFILNLTVACWVIMEGYFRFVYNESDSFAILQTHKMWFKKNVRLNDFGLRDDKDYAPLRGRKDLIFLLGDSYQWGQGIDFKDTVTVHLQESCSEYTFLNISGQGLSTSIELDNFKKMLSYGFIPKITVLNYYMNDIDSYGEIVRSDSISRNNLIINSLRFSYSIQHIYARVAGFTSKEQNLYAQLLADAYHGPSFNKHKEVILDIVHLARTNSARLLVVIWPALPVQEELNNDLNSTRKIVIDVLEKNNVEYIDLLPEISGLNRKSQIAGKFDAHPSAAVHKISADLIAGWIAGNGSNNPQAIIEIK
jgi:hypothetical protein